MRESWDLYLVEEVSGSRALVVEVRGSRGERGQRSLISWDLFHLYYKSLGTSLTSTTTHLGPLSPTALVADLYYYSFGTSLTYCSSSRGERREVPNLLGPLSPLLLLFWDLCHLYYKSLGTSLTSTALVVEVRGSSC